MLWQHDLVHGYMMMQYTVNVDAYGVVVFYNVKIHNAYIYHNIIFPLSSDLYQKSVGGMRRKMASEKIFKRGVLFLHLTMQTSSPFHLSQDWHNINILSEVWSD